MIQGLVFVLASSLAIGEVDPPQAETPVRCGQIFLAGNDVTPQENILGSFPIYPGQILSLADLDAADRHLRRRLWFLGIGYKITVLENPKAPNSEFKDILVEVRETPVTYLFVALPEAVLARLRRE
jgi:hypothetical protein